MSIDARANSNTGLYMPKGGFKDQQTGVHYFSATQGTQDLALLPSQDLIESTGLLYQMRNRLQGSIRLGHAKTVSNSRSFERYDITVVQDTGITFSRFISADETIQFAVVETIRNETGDQSGHPSIHLLDFVWINKKGDNGFIQYDENSQKTKFNVAGKATDIQKASWERNDEGFRTLITNYGVHNPVKPESLLAEKEKLAYLRQAFQTAQEDVIATQESVEPLRKALDFKRSKEIEQFWEKHEDPRIKHYSRR